MIILKHTYKALISILFFFVLVATTAYSSEKNHDQHSGEVDSHQEDESKENVEFEISSKAIKLMKIETAPLKMQKFNSFTIPNSALVSYGEKYGIYKLDGEHFELIPLTNIRKERSALNFKSDLVKKGDLIVVKGVPLLRVAHLQASGQGGEGHGH